MELNKTAHVIFRCDASLEIGTGHVMRCLTLANALRLQGSVCRFVCKGFSGNLQNRIQQDGFEVVSLPPTLAEIGKDQEESNLPKHFPWLGGSWQDDAEQTIAAIGPNKPSWLIVDHYGIDSRWEKFLRPHVEKIMVIDDLADREHDCDLLLDQNLVIGRKNRYKNLVKTDTQLIEGPKYALLQKEYAGLASRIAPRYGSISRILIYFGGSDNFNMTELALDAIRDLDQNNLTVDVVINKGNTNFDKVLNKAKKMKMVNVYWDLPSLAELMANAELFIGACGTTSWERCALGLPALVITIAENQINIARNLHKRGYVRLLGHCDKVKLGKLKLQIRNVLNSNIYFWSRRCKRLVDGKGTIRVASIISSDAKIKIRPVKLTDKNIITKWIQNKRIKEVKLFSKTEIAKWFKSAIKDVYNNYGYFFEDSSDSPVGYMIFKLKENIWFYNIFLPNHIKSKKLKYKLIKKGINKLKEDVKVSFGIIQDASVANLIYNKNKLKKLYANQFLSIAICSDASSWINVFIPKLLIDLNSMGHKCFWAHDAVDLPECDLSFYLSYAKIVDCKTRSKFKNNLVVHESKLPLGKGWSPLTWQVLEDQKKISVALIEAVDKIDSGPIYCRSWIDLDGRELVDELRKKQAKITFDLCKKFVREYPRILESAEVQKGQETYYTRRKPEDSALDINKSIKDLFNLFRVADSARYPAFFLMNGCKYLLKIKKVN